MADLPRPGVARGPLRWLRRLIIAMLVAALVYGGRVPLLRGVANALVIPASVQPVDLALVLGGDRCFEEAGRLYRDGTIRGALLVEYVPSRLVRIGVLPSNEEIARRELAKHGVPDDAIEVVRGNATSDWDAMRHLRQWMTDHPEATLLVECRQFGGREARFVLSNVLGPERTQRIAWHPLRDRRYGPANWWHRKEGVLDLFNSYVSFVYVWINGEQPSTYRELDADSWLAGQLGEGRS